MIRNDISSERLPYLRGWSDTVGHDAIKMTNSSSSSCSASEEVMICLRDTYFVTIARPSQWQIQESVEENGASSCRRLPTSLVCWSIVSGGSKEGATDAPRIQILSFSCSFRPKKYVSTRTLGVDAPPQENPGSACDCLYILTNWLLKKFTNIWKTVSNIILIPIVYGTR